MASLSLAFLIENGADVLIKFPAHKKALDLSLDRIRRFGSALKSVAIGTGAIIKTLLKERVQLSPDNERLSYYLHVAASAGDEERLQRWCSKKAWISTFKATTMVSLSRPNARIHIPNPPSAQLAKLGMSMEIRSGNICSFPIFGANLNAKGKDRHCGRCTLPSPLHVAAANERWYSYL